MGPGFYTQCTTSVLKWVETITEEYMQIKRHLTHYEREKIEYYLRLKMGIRTIARKLKRDHSVISREARRNRSVAKKYGAATAARIEERRRRRRKGRKLEKDVRLHDHVVRELRLGRSPDVIAGHMRTKPPSALRGKTVSQESIYRYIYEGEGRWEGLYHLLRYRHRKRRKHYQRKPHGKARILERISIHARPEEIETRRTFGHWETDSMIYQKQKTILSVQVERKSRLLRFHRATGKTAEETEIAIRKTIDSLPLTFFKTMTFDNGTEGANHRLIRDDYGITTYFCDTYSSWQKGSVENMNGIIRRFLPKQKDLSVLSDRKIYELQETINDTPRRSLGYLTPNEVVRQYLVMGH